MQVEKSSKIRYLEQLNIVQDIKKEAEIFAKNSVHEDIQSYRDSVEDTKGWDEDGVTYEYTVTMEFIMPYKDFNVRFKCKVHACSPSEVDIQDIELSDYISLAL